MGLRLEGAVKNAATGVATATGGAGKTAWDGRAALAESMAQGEGNAPEGDEGAGPPSSTSCQEALARLPLPLPFPLFWYWSLCAGEAE